MATNDQVQSLYIAYFGRPADAEGLRYWTSEENAGKSLSDIADAFAVEPEYKATTAGQSNAQIINSFYLNLFGRNAEVEGLNFWLDQVALGTITIQQIGVNIGQTAVNADPKDSDTAAIEAKFAASNEWTKQTGATTEGVLAYEGEQGVAAGVAFLEPVKTADDVPTEAEVTADVNALINSNSTGTSLDMSVFTDIAEVSGYTKLSGNTVLAQTKFKLDGQDQTVNGSNSTITAGDVLADSSTVDNDFFNVTLTNQDIQGLAGAEVGVSNLENIVYTVSSLETSNLLDGLSVTGAKSFKAAGSVDKGATVSLDASATGATSLDFAGLTGGDGDTSTVLAMGNGGNTITGSKFDDALTSGSGADTVNLGDGKNTFLTAGAGTGADSVTHDGTGSLVMTATGTGKVTLNAVSTGVETLSTAAVNTTIDASSSASAVQMTGNTGKDTLTGGDGKDTIGGGGGDDTLKGGKADDTIVGGDGKDTIDGGSGNDKIDAGVKVDSIVGGSGSNEFTQDDGDSLVMTNFAVGNINDIWAAPSIFTFGDGVDVISDFNSVLDTVKLTGGLVTARIFNVATVKDLDTVVDADGETFAIQGDWSSTAKTFTASLTGKDIILGVATAAVTDAAAFGISSVVLQGGAAAFDQDVVIA